MLRRAVLATALVALGTVGTAAPTLSAPPPTVTTVAVPSFDGTPILATLFVPPSATVEDPAPLVLQTHGWAGTGQRTPDGFVGDLLDAGYVVLTWDQRGFGCSGGQVGIAKPQAEGRDVTALIDFAVAQAPIATRDGDPIVGMTGGSYAGGIQTAAASVDDRIDALAPEISWSDLRYTLFPGRVVNQGWSLLLYAAGLPTAGFLGLDPGCPTFPQAGGLDPAITVALSEGLATGQVSAASEAFLGASSLDVYGESDPVAVPTLVVQGSVDTLFDLTDGYRIYQHVRAQGAPARFLVFCGGHVACPAGYGDAGDDAHVDAAVLAWFARHLDGDATVATGPAVEYRTNEATWRAATSFPPAGFTTMAGEGSGSLVSVPALEVPDVAELAEALVAYGGGIPALPVTSAQVSPDGDPRSLRVPLGQAGEEPVDLVGIPSVTLTVTPTVGLEVVLLAKLVDRESGVVVNLQEGAVRVPLTPGSATTVTVAMPGVAYTLPAGHHLDLQVSTASLMHMNARLPAAVAVTAAASVPAEAVATPPAAPAPAAPPSPPTEPTDASAPEASASGPLPATGAEATALLPLLLLAGAVVLRRAARTHR